jgi:NAD(P)-dependent dehydrogenase (short-subunit alcohol dehydrogenase family)
MMTIHGNILDLVTLDGKTAVVTGAASGIGAAVAKRLAEAGADIAVLDVDKTKGPQIEKDIQKLGLRAKFFACDVGCRSQCQKAIDGVLKDFGRLDILVNNAGVIIRKNIVDLSEGEWDRVLDINLKSIYLLSRLVIPLMLQNKGGSIVNLGSGWGIKGGPDAAAYCASKSGVVNLTRAMAIDHGRHGIRVNCVCPGDIHTALLESEAAQLKQDLNEFLGEASDRPIPRVGSPDDVANAVLFFACQLSAWVTGSILVVDGGGLA